MGVPRIQVKLRTLMITIAIAAVVLGVAVVALRPRRPIVFVRNPIVDMGTILQPTKGRASWLVEHRGGAPLRLSINALSDHMGGAPYPRGLSKSGTITVPPGGSTNVSFGWIIGDPSIARYGKGVTLATNDLDQPKLHLRAEFTVDPLASSDREFVGSFEIDEKPDGGQ